MSGEQISKSPLNQSTAKQMFSFSKEERFKAFHQKSARYFIFYPAPQTIFITYHLFCQKDLPVLDMEQSQTLQNTSSFTIQIVDTNQRISMKNNQLPLLLLLVFQDSTMKRS